MKDNMQLCTKRVGLDNQMYDNSDYDTFSPDQLYDNLQCHEHDVSSPRLLLDTHSNQVRSPA